MLAYINQEEADLLKARGGSGKPHADTGVPSFRTFDFEPDTTFDFEAPGTSEPAPMPLEISAAEPLDLTSTQAPSYQTFGEQKYLASQSQSPSAVAPSVSYGDFAAAPSGSRYTDENISGSLRDSAARAAVSPAYAPPTQDKDLLGQVSDLLPNLSEETKKRLGIAGIQGLIGAYQSQQAAEQGRQAKEEMQRMAQPYQQQGKRLIEQAQRGELSAVGQQQLQAVQAQAAQGAQARGGVGAQQAQMSAEAFRQQLLQNQYDYGLKVSNIGDQIALGAIKTGLQADQYVNQLTTTYFNNMTRTAYGQPPETPGQKPASTTPTQ